MTALFLAVFVVLLSSAICSGTEAALFSVPMVKVRQLAQSHPRAGKALLAIRDNMNRPIATIVIFNNVANITGSMAVGAIANTVLKDPLLGFFSGIMTFLVILFSEIIPKTLGEQYNDKISLFVAVPLARLTWILTPLLWLLERLTAPLNRNEERYLTNEAEIRLLARLGEKEGIIEKDEGEMIQRVFELNDLTAGELLTPRVVMTTLNCEDTLDEVKEKVLDSRHSRMIVVGETVDEIKGFVLKAELLKAMLEDHGDTKVGAYVNKVTFVPRQIKADALLVKFRANRQHLAVVLDEFGGVVGVISLEDVLEVLTGQIMDETDAVEDLQKEARSFMARKRRQS